MGRKLRFSLENVQALATHAYISHAEAAFGAPGAAGIRELLNWVKLIYQRYPPEGVLGVLTIVLGIRSNPEAPLTSGRRCNTVADVGTFLAEAQQKCLVVEVFANGTFMVLDGADDVDAKALAQSAIVYRLEASAERILAGIHDDLIPLISPVLRSNFAVPTLSGLEEALERYRGYALESRCRILKDIWELGVDGPRLVLVNKPEWMMRDSLVQALELTLQDATVKPEQNTDETKPVDIRVTWFASGAIALLEVKWLGKSTAKSSGGTGEQKYTEYGGSRAQDGADQLADYLDREVRHSDATVPRGYLVVFDARRKGTKGRGDRLSAADAMAFSNEPLSFNPDHAKSRQDFAPPVRFFLNPRKSLFLAA
jgi:hypothetical protein